MMSETEKILSVVFPLCHRADLAAGLEWMAPVEIRCTVAAIAAPAAKFAPARCKLYTEGQNAPMSKRIQWSSLCTRVDGK